MSKHYFLRHAHRHEFPPNDWGHEVSITEEGQKAAYQIGNKLSESKIEAICTSPIKRCVQTAEEIRNGIGHNTLISTSPLLGDPGSMVTNPQLAGAAFRQYTFHALMNSLLEGQAVPGFCSIADGSILILKKLWQHREETVVWITHDFGVCLLSCWIFQCQCSEKMLPDFLEGIEFTFTESGADVHYKGLRTMIDETSFRGICLSQVKSASLKSELNSSKLLS